MYHTVSYTHTHLVTICVFNAWKISLLKTMFMWLQCINFFNKTFESTHLCFYVTHFYWDQHTVNSSRRKNLQNIKIFKIRISNQMFLGSWLARHLVIQTYMNKNIFFPRHKSMLCSTNSLCQCLLYSQLCIL